MTLLILGKIITLPEFKTRAPILVFQSKFYKGFLFLLSCSANPIRSPSGPRM